MEDFIEMNGEELSAQLKDPKEVENSERKEKILRAVITWFTHNHKREDRGGLLEWFFSGSMQKATEYQLNIKRRLQEFVPALFENYKDNLTFAGKGNRTPLHCCISKMGNEWHDKPANYELVSALCDLGMSIVALDVNGYSPLGIALDNGFMDVVQVLILSCSINVADRNNRGQTALHILINKFYHVNSDYKKYQVLVTELLRKGANLNQPDQDGVTPVHLAAKKLDIELLQKFKENGANLNCRTNRGDDLLIIVCKSLTKSRADHEKVLELIEWLVDLQGFRADVKNNNGFTALHYASNSENVQIVRTLIRAGADVHAVADDHTNALHSAAASNNFEVMRHLIKQNVDFRRRDNVYGFSLLHTAALSGDPRKCEWLVKEKLFDVDDLGKWQLTPLHLASVLGNAKVVEKLTELGADVHRTDVKFHHTALHFASMSGLFTKLRDFKANGEEKTDNHSSIVDDCFNYHRFFDPCDSHTATVALLDAGAEVNATDSHGCTALHYAARHSVGDHIVASLLEAGAHVDVQDNECSTPLENCFVNDNHDGLIKLLTFGANINDIATLLNDDTYQLVMENCLSGYLIVDHLLKLKKAGFSIHESYKRYYVRFESADLKGESEFSSELTRMKERMLTDEVSLYDLLHMNYKHRSTFANSLPRDIVREFPKYYVVLKGRCNEAVNRMALFEPAREAFQWMTGMPDICIDIIFSFMTNRSLRVLIDAASLTEL